MNQAVESNVVEKAQPVSKIDRGAQRDRLLIIALIAIGLGAWYTGKLDLYEADSPLGYNLGLVGGIAMATLLLYPLRKRFRLMRSWFPIKYWFGAHMALGIIGPVLIMYHSNFILESKNGAIAFYSMMAVFISGLVGRIIYRRIHFGLFGRKATLGDMKHRLGLNEENIRSRFHKMPEIEKRLAAFENRVVNPTGIAPVRMYRAMTTRIYSRWVRFRILSHLRRVLSKRGKKKEWSSADRRRRYQLGKSIVVNYLDAVNEIAQFGLYERLFSLWHIAHVPLIFLLVATAIIHVVAVHMY